MPKRAQDGWSSPSFVRMRAMSSAVARSPAISAAGSPGREIEQREDEERHHPHDRDGGEQAPDEIGEHAR